MGANARKTIGDPGWARLVIAAGAKLGLREVPGNFFLNGFEHVGPDGRSFEWLIGKRFFGCFGHSGLQIGHAAGRNGILNQGIIPRMRRVDIELVRVQFGLGRQGTA